MIGKLRKLSIKCIRFFYKPALILVTLQGLVITLFIFENRGKIANYIDSPRFIRLLGSSFDTFEIDDYSMYLKELVSSLTSFGSLPRMDLSIKFKKIQQLECSRKRNQNCTKDGWIRGGEIFFNNEIYEVKLRGKGDRDFHREKFKNMSFKVDIRGDKRLYGMEEFSLQSPVIRNYTQEALVSRLLKKEGVISPKHYYVRFFINGEYSGIRHIEEAMGRELIESNKRRYGPVFSLDETVSLRYQNNPFDLADKKNWIYQNDGLPSSALSVLRATQVNPELFNMNFDIEKWSKYMAMLDTFQMFHGTVPKSVKYYLNPITGLIEPIYFDGHYGTGLFYDYRLFNLLKANDELPECRWTCADIKFYRMMFGTSQKVNKRFYLNYLKYLEKYTSLDFINGLVKKEINNLSIVRGNLYKSGYKKDQIWHYGLFPHIYPKKKIEKRIKKIRLEIKDSKTLIPNHSYSSKSNQIKLLNNTSKVPQIYSLYCKDDYLLSTYVLVKNVNINLDMNLIKNKCKFEDTQFSLNRGESKTYLKNILKTDLDLDQILKEKVSKNKNKFTNLSEVLIEYKPGKNIIKKNSYIKNKIVSFESGSNICLEKGSILHIIDSEIIAKGTEIAPVIINQCSQSSGSVIIENSKIKFNNIQVSGLVNPKKKLRLLYGGINFINSNIKGKVLTISNALSEDAVNFINSDVDIDNISFIQAKSDGLDSDYSNLKFKEVFCKDIGNDCIDMSYSYGFIRKLIANRVLDKVISLGESSKLYLFEIKSIDSEMGLVSKDNSYLNVDNYSYANLKIPISAFIKKTEFGPPSIVIKNLQSKTKNYNLDFISLDSKLIINGKVRQGYKTSSQVMDKLYGNLYGIKTKR